MQSLTRSPSAFLAVVVLVGLVVAACGPGDVPAGQGPLRSPGPTAATVTSGSTITSGPSADTGTGRPTVTRNSTPTPGPGNGASPRSARKINIPLPSKGPASGDTPPPFRWYEAVQKLDCQGLSDTADPLGSIPQAQIDLFASLAEVCWLLLGEEDDVDWAAAEAVLDATAGESDCLLIAARGMLAAAVDAYETSPEATLTPGPVGKGTACEPTVTSAEIQSGTITVTGEYLFEIDRITVADTVIEHVELDSENPPSVTVTANGVPCLPTGDVITIEIAGADGAYRVTEQLAQSEVIQPADCPGTDSPAG